MRFCLALTCFLWVLAAWPALPAETNSFEIQLPGVKIAYPGTEYWAEIGPPAGDRFWAYAVYEGGESWRVAFVPARAGTYRLLRVEGRQGEKRSDVTLGPASQRDCVVRAVMPRKSVPKQTLVEAGEFETFFAAEEPWCVNDHALVQGPDDRWHLFGITHPKPLDFFKDPGRRLAHATAETLLQKPWSAMPPAVTANWEKYREYLLWAPHVIRYENLYYMFVCVGDKATHRYPIHLLTSPDLENWTRHPANPMVVDGFDGRDPMILRSNDKWFMYYTATTTPEGGNHVVAAVTSRDLVRWAERKVVFVHPRAGSFGGPTESPFVVQRGKQYYLFVCDNAWTDVYVSSDPLHWDYEHTAGRIKAHAAEIVRDATGKWYITHAGWMEGPLKIAPLIWKDGLDNEPASVPPAK